MEKNKIFISHRHSDTQSDCHRIKSDLEKIFGKDQVFLDIENLEPGIKFAEAIEKTLAQSKVVLVVIGRDWLNVSDEHGNRRLLDPKDWVRREIAAALNSPGTRVIPVLVKDAEIPAEDQLPEDLKPLSQLQVAEITTKRWDYDLGELVKVLEKLVPKIKKEPEPQPYRPYPPIPPKPKSWLAKNYLWLLGSFVGIVLLVGLCTPEDTYVDPYQDTNTDQNTVLEEEPIPNNQTTETNDPDPRETNPGGNEIYNSLTLEQSVPDFSGNWWLYENNVRSGYFSIQQDGADFSFTYFYFDQPVGSGIGHFEDDYLVSDSFVMPNSPGNYAFSFLTQDGGQNWVGETYANQITSQSYLVRRVTP